MLNACLGWWAWGAGEARSRPKSRFVRAPGSIAGFASAAVDRLSIGLPARQFRRPTSVRFGERSSGDAETGSGSH